MIHTIQDRNIFNVVRAHTFKTGNIEAVLLRIRTALVMGVDPARPAEIVFRRPGIELVDGQRLMTLDHLQVSQAYRGNDCAPAASL